MLILLPALFSSINVLGNTYVGFYNVINWPVISVSVINGTYTSNGIVILISPEEPLNQEYATFTGIGLIGGNYLLINGIIYANGTIDIAETIPINASVSLGVTNNKAIAQLGINITTYPSDYEMIGQRTYHIGQLEREFSINAAINNSALVIHGTQLGNSPSNKTGIMSMKMRGNRSIVYAIIDSSLITTIALITLLMISPSVLKYQVYNDKECINELFAGLIRRLGIRDPSLTHRDIRNYLAGDPRVNNDIIDKLIDYYEAAIYGNKPIKCEEFKKVIREALNASARGRN